MAVSADKAAIDFECVLQPPSSSPSVIGTTRKHFRVASNRQLSEVEGTS